MHSCPRHSRRYHREKSTYPATGRLHYRKSFLETRIVQRTDKNKYGYLSSDGNGYRQYLQTDIKNAGASVTFVGSVKSGTMTNNNNEGHSGWVISQIAGAAAQITSLDPGIVLLHAGTNDCNNPSLAATAYQRLGSLVDQLIKQWPDATILVAKIIPSTNSGTNTAISNLNAQIPGLVATRANAGHKVAVVDMSPPNFTTSELGDYLHPSAEGYNKMATLWLGGLNAAAARGWLGGAATSSITSPITTKEPTSTARATIVTSTKTSAAAVTSTAATVAKYGQCGGQGYSVLLEKMGLS
ncbi:hypothetical protein LTR78_009908 [Recurvomyces mirabilis]|uniref:SGNH hydrolase-type esterase domain-containing protein n=1 Tax=Recurvomyces mirabilis TaxID=574656 RepID=A0AAE0WIF7_9PEZI|nr:hypothetical protein LTR78_009908 [Recurvomyces mirabilis]KAK5150583.1 hypothetical protein LTS14_010077 [Recurvomyces mirabilis]